jgi:chromosome segregation ATPase
MALLKAVPLWVWAVVLLIALLIALLAGALVYQTLALASARTEHADYVAGVDKAAKEASDAARAEEQRRQREIDQVRNDAQHQIKAAADDAAVAASAADSLQQQVDKLLASRASCNTRVAQGSQAIDDLTNVLADLRRRADERAGELARIADENRIAGLACEKAYESLSADRSTGRSISESQVH